ncbi:MAG: hypothetical protein ACFFCT_02820 [Candidatus Odinarchaeota archaeon]
MSLPARISFAQIGILVSIIVYISVRGFFAMLNVGLLWTQIGGFFLIVIPLPAVIVLGFTACVVSYAFTYLGLWMMDNNYYLLGVVTVFLSVIIIPGGLGVYSWFGFTITSIP